MAIHVQCPGCSAAFRVKDQNAGRTTKCPKCGAPFTIPAAPSSEGAPDTAAFAPAPGGKPVAQVATWDSPASREVEAVVVASAPRSSPGLVIDPDAEPVETLAPVAPAASPWIWIGVAGAFLAVLLLALGLWANGAFEPKKIVEKDRPGRRKLDVNHDPLFTPDPEQIKEHARRARPAENAPLEELIKYFDNGVVKIEGSDLRGNIESLGTGFIIDDEGHVATNLHVIAGEPRANVAFRDGTRFGVLGVRAFDASMDLAILELNGHPDNIEPLTLAANEPLAQGKEILAIGHPHGYEFTTTRGIIGAVRETKSFPADTRKFLHEFPDDFVWIQHDAAIASGNSGGPILNRRGDVLGVNTWVDTEAKTNFASHVKYLAALYRRMAPSWTPLYELPHEQSEGPALSPEMVREQRSTIAADGWNPKDREAYLAMQNLVYMTWRSLGDDALRGETDATLQALRSADWDAKQQIPKINDFAGDAMSGRGGLVENWVFLVATVDEPPVEMRGDNGSGWVCWTKFFGSDEKVLVVTRQGAAVRDLTVGDEVVVMGAVVGRTSIGEQKINTVTAPVVAAGVVAPIRVAK